MKKRLAILNKEGVIRGQGVRECPFGLKITISCASAGDSVDKMQSLEDIDKDKRNKYRAANRRVYRHHKTGERCVYADKIIEDKNMVNCDFRDTGERISDTPLKPSPFYPRVFSGIGQTGLYAFPINYYLDNSEAQQLFSGIFHMYASTGEIPLQKTSFIEPDYHLVNIYEEVKDIFNIEE